MAPSDFVTIDLDAERARRAAEREVSGESMPLVLGGKTIANLPVELPLAALAPLRKLDEEITLLVRAAIDMWRANEDAAARWDATSLIIDVLASNPKLPSTALDVVEEMARVLLGDEGFDALMEVGLVREDVGFLFGRIMEFYGVTLGESSPSSESSTEGGGETSSTTSEQNSDSTPATSSDAPAILPSSESAAS